VLFSPYNSSGVRVLTNEYADALGFARSALPRKLSDQEDAILSQRLTRNLMDAHDSGERDPEALRRSPKTTESGVMWRETWVAGIPALEDWV
jgi:hypothetical protein